MFDPTRGYPSVVPYFRYADPAAAIGWLVGVLGAREALRLTLADGRLGHAELVIGQSVVSVGAAVAAPRAADPNVDRVTLCHMTLVFVDDVDAVMRRVADFGGSVVDPPTNQPWGLRQAIVRDPEGYLWEPSEHLRDVDPATWGAHIVGRLPG